MSIDIDVLTWLSNFTSVRGWMLIVLTALGGYVALGIPGAFAFALGAAAGLNASGEWEEEVDDAGRGAPPGGGDPSDSPLAERWSNWRGRSNRTLHFAPLNDLTERQEAFLGRMLTLRTLA